MGSIHYFRPTLSHYGRQIQQKCNSGTIDFREFMLALHVTSSGTPEEKLTWAFRMYDVDGSGSIDFGEMKRIVSAVYEMIGAYGDLNKAHELFSKMDQNSDGLVS